MYSLSSASTSASKQFVEKGALIFLQFIMQKYSIKDDAPSLSLCMSISQVNFVVVWQITRCQLLNLFVL
jgi:hypothetical protein